MSIRIPLLYSSLGKMALMLAALPLSAQQNQAALTVETASGKNSYHIGERIPLKLTFSSPDDTDYLISPLIRGRGGEFNCNRFEVVSPATGWSDPFEMYFKQDLLWTGHGWPWRPLRKSTPVEASLDLNEWLRFDQPGEYRIKVTSSCVSKIGTNQAYSLSVTIQLTIVPGPPEWQDLMLKSLLPALYRPDGQLLKSQQDESSQTHWERLFELSESARADLKFLATPAAVDEMTYGLRDEKGNVADQFSMALKGLPPSMRARAISAMNQRIGEPDFPINRWFFDTLSFLGVTPGSEKESIRKQREAANPVIWKAIFSAVTKKEPAAMAETVQTLLAYGRNVSTPEVKQGMASLLKLSFANLSSSNQIDDLRNEWDLLKSPEILPVLQKLARLPVENDSDLQVWVYDRQQLKGLALMRWYELDPDGAHREIVAQIGSASPSLAAQSIAFLPDEQFPQFEPIWAQAFLDTSSQLRERALGSLLVRFGTGVATNQMIAKLEVKRSNPCDGHVVALAYLAKFNPELARQRLEHENQTNAGDCGAALLTWISELTVAPVLNDLAVENLDSSEPAAVIEAARFLMQYGRKQDEAPLWRRYVAWTSAYAGKADLLDKSGPGGWDKFASSIMGEQLGNALIRNQGWFADPELIAGALERCVGDSMCKGLKDAAHWAVSPYQLNLPDMAMPSVGLAIRDIGVAQYGTRSLKLFEEKVAQFPPGSKFVLPRWYRPSNSDARNLEKDVRTIIEKHGMSLADSAN